MTPSAVRKDMTALSVHTPTAIGNEDPKRKARSFKAIIGQAQVAPNPADVGKRSLQPHDASTCKSPFPYDPNALASLRPDQVPRFFGCLTDGDRLPLADVMLDGLTAMQDRVDPAKVAAIGDRAGGKPAVVVGMNGKNYIADGHHRLTADWLAGKESAQVRYKDLEPVDNALKRATGAQADGPLNFRIAKIDDSLGVVFGFAIVCKVNGQDYYDLNVDHVGPHAGERVPEHIPEDVMLKAACDFAKTAMPGNEMHDGPDVGSYAFVFPLTTDIAKAMGITTEKTGLMVGYSAPPAVLAKFRDGTYTGFSIEGRRLAFIEHADTP